MEQAFWENLYENNTTGWDIGKISTPIKGYVDQLTNKELSILIPGCGFGHEAAYLHQHGFRNVFILDFSSLAINEFKLKNPTFPADHIIQEDFFQHHGRYDLIIEQTLFCAIHPTMRDEYVKQTAHLLKAEGKLVGLLFNCEFEAGPPFGGNIAEYHKRFSKYFSRISIEPCYNSISPRKDKEVFIKMIL